MKRAVLYEVKVRKRKFTSPTVVALGLLESLPQAKSRDPKFILREPSICIPSPNIPA